MIQFGPLDDLIEVVLKGGEVKRPWTGYMLRTLPPPWNIDAVLHIRALRGETLDRKSRQEARNRLSDWYGRELANQGKQSLSLRGGGGEEAKKRMSARALAWKLQSSPLVEATKDTVGIIRDCVYSSV